MRLRRVWFGGRRGIRRRYMKKKGLKKYLRKKIEASITKELNQCSFMKENYILNCNSRLVRRKLLKYVQGGTRSQRF